MNAESSPARPAWIERWLLELRSSRPSLQRDYGLQHLWLIGLSDSAGEPAGVHVLAQVERALDYAHFARLQEDLSRLLKVTVEVVVRGDLDPDIEAMVFPAMLQAF